MSNPHNKRLIGLLASAILILFAFLAILNANLLSWPLAEGGRTQTQSHGGPPTGELVVSAMIAQPQGFTNSSLGIVSLNQFIGPLPGVSVGIFNQDKLRVPLGSNRTDASGILTLNLSEGLYTVNVNTNYSKLSVPISIVNNVTTYLNLEVNESQHMASFYDMPDTDSAGIVLPSESVFLQFTYSWPQVNASESLFLQSYHLFFSQSLIQNENGTVVYSGIFLFSQIQQVPAVLVSLSSDNSSSLWIETMPNSVLFTEGIQYMALADFSTTYSITNSTSGVQILA